MANLRAMASWRLNLNGEMVKISRTDSSNEDFTKLVRLLDAELAERDGAEHSFYAQFNKITTIKYAVIAYEMEMPVGCGAIREFSPGVMEIKRMYTLPESRGKGVASKILMELEKWAAELSYEKCVLETGSRQPEAINLYTKKGFSRIPNYGQYTEVGNSLCFEKKLK